VTRRAQWLAAGGIAVLLAFGWVVTLTGPLAATRVTVARVSIGDVQPALFGIGTVEARRAYLIGPTTAGRVKRVFVDVGEAVAAGQVLAEMDPVELDARLGSADAAVARARSAVIGAKAQFADAASRLTPAAAEARRYEDLGRQGFVGPSVVETKRQQAQSAQAQLAAAESALASASHEVQRLQAERVAVGQQRASIRLLAPTAGVVSSRDAEPGSTVVAGQAVVRLMEPASLWVRARLDQRRAGGLREGLPARITLRSSAPDVVPGRVARLEPVSDSITEERIAQVAFDSLPPGVSIGEMAEVVVNLPTVRDAVRIPNAALLHGGAQPGVWLHDAKGLRFVNVRTGAEGPDGMVQIVQGLKAGDDVVVYSERELDVGSRVKIVPTLVASSP